VRAPRKRLHAPLLLVPSIASLAIGPIGLRASSLAVLNTSPVCETLQSRARATEPRALSTWKSSASAPFRRLARSIAYKLLGASGPRARHRATVVPMRPGLIHELPRAGLSLAVLHAVLTKKQSLVRALQLPAPPTAYTPNGATTRHVPSHAAMALKSASAT